MEFLIYLLKSSVLLSLFLLVYELFLRQETYYTINRLFLWAGVIIAAVLPAVTYTNIRMITPETQETHTVTSVVPVGTASSATAPEFWENPELLSQTALLIYGTVLLVLFIVFFVRLAKLGRLLYKPMQSSYRQGICYIETTEKTGAFSFFNRIVFNPDIYDEEELKLILRHEEAHVKGLHSADVLLAHLICLLNWFNPFILLYRKRIAENLEFLADREATRSLQSPKTYQLILLKAALGNKSPYPVNSFKNSFITTRIKKLQQHPSHQKALLKLGFILPLLAGFFLLFQVKTQAQQVFPDQNEVTGAPQKQGYTFLLTPQTGIEELQELQQALRKENDAELTFSDLKFDTSQKLTQIHLRLVDTNKKVYRYSLLGDKPIPKVQLVISDAFTGFRTFTKKDRSAFVDRHSAIIIHGKPNSQLEEVLGAVLRKELKEKGKADEQFSSKNSVELIQSLYVIKGEESIMLVNDKESASANTGHIRQR